ADLVTLIEPTHPLSYLAYLRDADRLYSFFVREDLHPTRREYESYLRWAAARLPRARFGHRVESVGWEADAARFVIDVRAGDASLRVRARDIVVGIGTEPSTPPALAALTSAHLVHSGDYLARRDAVSRAQHVTVVGAGQSGAEVVLDLLRRNTEGGPAVTWL